jgi:hypothetical protein
MMMLEGLDVAVFRHDASAGGGEPDADLWVVQGPDSDSLGAFIAADARRRAVVLQAPSRIRENGEAQDWLPGDRVSVVALTSPPSELRDVLSAAVVTVGRPARTGETRGAGAS